MPFRWIGAEWRIDSLALTAIMMVTIAVCTSVVSGKLVALHESDSYVLDELQRSNATRREDSLEIQNQIGELKEQIAIAKKNNELKQELIGELRKSGRAKARK